MLWISVVEGSGATGKTEHMNIYVGNLAREVTDQDLEQTFAAYGRVVATRLVRDQYSGQCRGFAFLEMVSRMEGSIATAALNGEELKGQIMVVNEARPRTDTGSRENRGWYMVDAGQERQGPSTRPARAAMRKLFRAIDNLLRTPIPGIVGPKPREGWEARS